MSRRLRILFVAAMALCIAGVSVSYACDSHKKAEQASASATSADSHGSEAASSVEGTASGCKAGVAQQASTGGCTAAEKAACAAKGMSAENCNYCGFVSDLRANAEKVQFTVVDGKDGVQFVFAAVSKDDVVTAQSVASKGYALMSGPSHCEVTKAKMAASGCDGCKEGLAAFSGAEIVFKNTDNGAVATVKTADKTKIEQLHVFAKGLLPVQEAVPQG